MDSSDFDMSVKDAIFNKAMDDQVKYYNRIRNIYEQLGLCSVYAVIFVFGLFGNLRVIYSVLSDKSKRTEVNVFMSNLAVANILLCSFILPLSPAFLFVDFWPFGWFMCHLWHCIFGSVCYSSSLTMASIALDRYLVIVKPLKETLNMRKSIMIIVIQWLVSTVVSLPFGVFMSILTHPAREFQWMTACVSDWPSMTSMFVYMTIASTILLLIPLIVNAFCYIAMSVRISNMSTPDNPIQIADIRRTNRLLITMAIAFYVCWMPITILEVTMIASLLDYWPMLQFKHIEVLLRVFHVMAMSSTWVNPLFYVWLNQSTIKQFFLIELRCKRQLHLFNDGRTYYVIKNEDRITDDVTYDANCDVVQLVSVETDE